MKRHAVRIHAVNQNQRAVVGEVRRIFEGAQLNRGACESFDAVYAGRMQQNAPGPRAAEQGDVDRKFFTQRSFQPPAQFIQTRAGLAGRVTKSFASRLVLLRKI